MKIVYYSDSKQFELTDREFYDAQRAWAGDKWYHCKRLNVVLTKFIKIVETPTPIFVLRQDGNIFKFIKVADKLYSAEAMTPLKFDSDVDRIIFESKLVSIDEYLDHETTKFDDKERQKLLEQL